MLIIIAAHIPIFTLTRHEGRIFAPMAYSVVSALIGALILSLTLVPLLCAVMLKKNLPEKENFIVHAAKSWYEPALAWALRRKKTVLAIAVASLAGSLALVPTLGSEFLPELNEGAVWVNVTLPTSVSVSEAQEMVKKVRNAIRKFPEVEQVNSKVGRPEDGTDPKLINMAEFLVDLKPESDWKRGIDKPKLLREIEAEIVKTPGITPTFSQPIRDNVLESISQIDGQIVVKVFGDDLEVLRDKALEVLKQVQDVPGVARAFVDRLGELPQIQIKVDRARAARYGLNVGDVGDVIESALGGKQVTQLWEGEQRFGVAVRLEESERTLTRMQGLLVATPGGAYVPLSEIANFRTVGGLMNIARENGKRVFAIGVFIRGRDMGSVVADMQANVKKNVPLPEGYSISWSGEFENQERAMARLSVIVPISILIIFLLLFDAFKSFRNSFLIILNIPFSVIGGILALWITGIYLSVSAAIGFIALFGQAVLNGVVMVTLFNELKNHGMSAEEAVVKGALMRLRTILMTALLASLGLLPMALSTGIGAETQKPLAVVVIGGLVSATLLVLFVMPVLYVILARFHVRRRKATEHSPPADAD
jgi:cobalt-zinc-cadmium resistance protein CzcA